MTKKSYNTRDIVLERIRSQIESASRDSFETRKANVEQRLSAKEAFLIPELQSLTASEKIDYFKQKLTESGTRFVDIKHLGALPEAARKIMDDALKAHDQSLIHDLIIAEQYHQDDQEKFKPDWTSSNIRTIMCPTNNDQYNECHFALNYAFAGIAETGSLLVHSGKTQPNALNFLASHHLIALKKDHIVNSLDDGWARLRKSHYNNILPRSLVLITG
ncbi:MAG: LUD domain-containing protein, partial [Pseudomonadota bacterium]